MATVPSHPIEIGRRGLDLTVRSVVLLALALILLAPTEAHASLLSPEAEDALAKSNAPDDLARRIANAKRGIFDEPPQESKEPKG